MAVEQCHGDGILDYTMELQNTPASINDGKTAHEKYTNSVVWFRKSRTALVSFDYEFIQIVDGNGAILQPAYDDWLATADALGLRTYITSHLKKKTVPAWCLDYF
jgi:hypothetical protein